MRFIQIIKNLISRSAVGLLVGFTVGTISGLTAGLLVGIVTNDASAQLIGAVALGGCIGAPFVGLFAAWSVNVADYKSRSGIEWGIIGATIAILVAWLERFDFAIAIVFAMMYAITAVFVHDTTSVLFGDESRIDHVTPRSFLLYGIIILVTTVVIFQVFGFFESLTAD